MRILMKFGLKCWLKKTSPLDILPATVAVLVVGVLLLLLENQVGVRNCVKLVSNWLCI